MIFRRRGLTSLFFFTFCHFILGALFCLHIPLTRKYPKIRATNNLLNACTIYKIRKFMPRKCFAWCQCMGVRRWYMFLLEYFGKFNTLQYENENLFDSLSLNKAKFQIFFSSIFVFFSACSLFFFFVPFKENVVEAFEQFLLL